MKKGHFPTHSEKKKVFAVLHLNCQWGRWSMKYFFWTQSKVYHTLILLYSTFSYQKFVSDCTQMFQIQSYVTRCVTPGKSFDPMLLRNMSWTKMSFTTLRWVTWPRHIKLVSRNCVWSDWILQTHFTESYNIKQRFYKDSVF